MVTCGCAAGALQKNIVVCCDGSWCGDATGTVTNIQIIANSIAGKTVASGVPVPAGNAVVCYFRGVGEGGNFADYLIDGALALFIRKRCVEAYAAIVEHYSPGSSIWLFGLSRGAFTVRSVAGMINNLGVLKYDNIDDAQRSALCNEVYSIYRNRDKAYNPDSPFSERFRTEKSHPRTPDTQPPIRCDCPAMHLRTLGWLGASSSLVRCCCLAWCFQLL